MIGAADGASGADWADGAPEGTPYGIGDATPGDAAALALVLGDWVREVDWLPRLHTRDEDLGFVLGLLKTHVVRLGFAGGMGFLARRDVEVSALYLAPSARGKGLGKALLDEAKAMGHLQLWVFQANHAARAFYRREGFREVRLTDGADNDEKLPDVWMEWRT